MAKLWYVNSSRFVVSHSVEFNVKKCKQKAKWVHPIELAFTYFLVIEQQKMCCNDSVYEHEYEKKSFFGAFCSQNWDRLQRGFCFWWLAPSLGMLKFHFRIYDLKIVTLRNCGNSKLRFFEQSDQSNQKYGKIEFIKQSNHVAKFRFIIWKIQRTWIFRRTISPIWCQKQLKTINC